MIKTLLTATAVSLMASTAFAGSLNTDFEKPAEPATAFVPTGTGIGAPAVIGGLLAAGAIIAIVASDDSSTSNHPVPDAD